MHPAIAWAEPDYLAQVAVVPDDTLFPSQWGPSRVNAPHAWDMSVGGSRPLIAIVDTGVDYSHPDLGGKLLPGATFVNGTTTAADDYGHGTHVAGIAAAESNNVTGVAGMAWANPILPVKALDSSGSGTYSAIAQAIMYAADSGATVINMSLGGSYDSQTLRDACQYAYNKGCTLVAAAGNQNSYVMCYPAAYPTVIAVGATDQSDTRAYFSNYGPQLSVAAPGVDILSTMPTGLVTLNTSYGYSTMYDSLSGTSMATPHVAGLAALLLSVNPSLGPDGVRNVLQRTALDLGDLGWDEQHGYGRIQADAAVAEALHPSPLDATPPSVAILTPAAGATLSGAAAVTINASDNVGVSRVEYAVDGVLRKAGGTQWTWQTGDDANGSHSLTATVRDYAGNWTAQTIVVNVSNTLTTDTFLGSLKTAYVRYPFTTRMEGRIRAVLSWNKGARLTLDILYSNGTTAGYNWSGRSPSVVEITRPAGNYMAQVGIMNGKASYTLSVTHL
jgi:subtilisin family serine protease